MSEREREPLLCLSDLDTLSKINDNLHAGLIIIMRATAVNTHVRLVCTAVLGTVITETPLRRLSDLWYCFSGTESHNT